MSIGGTLKIEVETIAVARKGELPEQSEGWYVARVFDFEWQFSERGLRSGSPTNVRRASRTYATKGEAEAKLRELEERGWGRSRRARSTGISTFGAT